MSHHQRLTMPFAQCLLGFALLLAMSCVSLKPMATDTKAIDALPQYWLAASLYAGPFYKNSDLTLMDYRPMSLIDDAKMPDGATIYPPRAERIIEAGTLAQIIKVSYPHTKEALLRPAFSPKDNIWLHMRVAKERGLVSVFWENEHILIVPKEVKTKEQLKGFINSLFSKKDPHLWILSQQRLIQDGIWHKKPVIGMSKRDIKAALGPAHKKQQQKNQGEDTISELWHYPHYFIVFKDNEVVKIKNLMAAKSITR